MRSRKTRAASLAMTRISLYFFILPSYANNSRTHARSVFSTNSFFKVTFWKKKTRGWMTIELSAIKRPQFVSIKITRTLGKISVFLTISRDSINGIFTSSHCFLAFSASLLWNSFFFFSLICLFVTMIMCLCVNARFRETTKITWSIYPVLRINYRAISILMRM